MRPTPARTRASAAGQPRPPAPIRSALFDAKAGSSSSARSGSGLKVLIEAEISLSGVAKHRDDRLFGPDLPREIEGYGDVGARTDADEESLTARELTLHAVSALVRDEADLRRYGGIVVLRDEPSGDALDLGRAALALGDGG